MSDTAMFSDPEFTKLPPESKQKLIDYKLSQDKDYTALPDAGKQRVRQSLIQRFASAPTTAAAKNQSSPNSPKPAPPAAPSGPSRQQIDDYRMKYFNTDNAAANIPKATAAALAKDPNNPDTLKRLSRMSPVGQAAIREHAGEMKAENDRTQAYIHSFDGGASPQVMAESLHAIAGGGGFVNPVQQQAYKAQQIPGFDPSAAFKGPEGAKQGKMTGHGALDPSLNVLADFAAFAATPEGAAFGEAMGTIGSLGSKAAKVATGAAVAMGEADAVNRYRKGDKQGAATSAVLGVLPLGIHKVAERVSAKAEARKAIANDRAVSDNIQQSGQGSVAGQGIGTEQEGRPIESKPTASSQNVTEAPADTEQGAGAKLDKVKPKEGATEAQKQEIAARNAAIEAKRNFSIDPDKQPAPKPNGITPGQVDALSQNGLTKAGDLFREAKKSNPNLTEDEFAQQLYEFHKGDTHEYQGPSGNAKPKDIFTATTADGRRVRYYGFEQKATPKAETVSASPVNQTKIANAHVDAQRAIFDLDPTASPEDVQHQKDVTERVLSQGLHNDAVRVATEVLKNPRPMTTDELAANALKQHQLKDSLNDIQSKIKERVKAGGDTSDLQTEYDMTREDYKTLTDASRRTGTEQGRGLAFRKHIIDDDSHTNITDRMEMADPHTPLSVKDKENIGNIREDIERTDSAVTEHEKGAPEREEAESKAAVEEAVEKLKPKKTRVGRTPEQRAKVKTDILTEREEIKRRFIKNASKASAGFDPTLLKDIRDLAASHAKEGLLNAEGLVQEIHSFVSEHLPDTSLRDIRDAISGYGHASPIPRATRLADIKEQLRLTSQIEDIHNRVFNPGKNKRAVSPEVQALREQKSQALADERGKPRRKGFARQTVEQRVKNYQKALENKINDYDRRIQARDFSSRERNPLPIDDHTRELIKNRDQLKAIYESIKPKTPYDPADTNRLQRLTKQFETIDARHQQHIFGERKPAPRADTPEEAAMRAKLTASNQQEKAMQAAKGAYVDPFAKQKVTMQKQIADMERQIAAGQPDPHIDNRQARPMDAEGERLKAARKEVGRRLNQMIDARKPKTAADKFLSYRRFAALSHLTTLGKLGMASAKRVFLTSPLESVAGAVTRRLPVLNRIAEKAPEGTPTLKGQLKGWNVYREKQTFESTMQKLKTSVNHLDIAYGDAKHVEEESLASWAGRLHGAIKTHAQIAEFNKSMSIQEDFYRKQGIDTSDPATQVLMATKAYATSREAILMQDNAVTSAFYEAVNSLERSKNPTARGTAVIAKAAIPIAKVPSNYVGEALLKTPGVGLIRLAPLLGRSVESLTPAEADLVMKVFRKQGVGLAMATAGWIAYNRVGGNYLPHKKPEPGGPDIGAYKTPLGNLSHTWNHSADDDVVMMAADAHRAIEHDRQRGENLLTQLGSGWYAAGVGTSSDVPFVDVVNKLARAQESSSAFGTMVGEEGTGMVMPGIVPDIAQFLDKDEEGNVRKRKVRGFGDAIKYGIGARSLLEEKR